MSKSLLILVFWGLLNNKLQRAFLAVTTGCVTDFRSLSSITRNFIKGQTLCTSEHIAKIANSSAESLQKFKVSRVGILEKDPPGDTK